MEGACGRHEQKRAWVEGMNGGHGYGFIILCVCFCGACMNVWMDAQMNRYMIDSDCTWADGVTNVAKGLHVEVGRSAICQR